MVEDEMGGKETYGLENREISKDSVYIHFF